MAEDKELPHALTGHEYPEPAPAFLPEAMEGVLSHRGHSPAHKLELKGFSAAESFIKVVEAWTYTCVSCLGLWRQ